MQQGSSKIPNSHSSQGFYFYVDIGKVKILFLKVALLLLVYGITMFPLSLTHKQAHTSNKPSNPS